MNKKLPQLKKDIKIFLTSEEGKIAKGDIIKIGLALTVLATALGGTMKPFDASAHQICAHSSHSVHSSHSAHSVHSVHSSHSSY